MWLCGGTSCVHVAHAADRDLYGDIALLGGIALSSFTQRWTEMCLAMDANDFGQLPTIMGPIVKAISQYESVPVLGSSTSCQSGAVCSVALRVLHGCTCLFYSPQIFSLLVDSSRHDLCEVVMRGCVLQRCATGD